MGTGKNIPYHGIECLDQGFFPFQIIMHRRIQHDQDVIPVLVDSPLRVERIEVGIGEETVEAVHQFKKITLF